MSKFNLNDITLKNVKAYVQGNLRYLTEQFGPNFLKMESYIREQIMFRKDIANPECIKGKECTKCGCDIPQLFYADKQCGGKCYPQMMEEEEWRMFQKSLSNYSLENQVDLIEYPFDWESIVESSEIDSEDISALDDTKLQDLIFEAGDVKIGDKIEHVFVIKNDTDYNKRVIAVNTTCNCTTLNDVVGSYLPINGKLEVTLYVDTAHKTKPGPKSVLGELTFNNREKTRLIIKFNLIKNESN